MGPYSTFVALLLITEYPLDQDTREEDDELLVRYDLDIAEDMYYFRRYRLEMVHSTIAV